MAGQHLEDFLARELSNTNTKGKALSHAKQTQTNAFQ
jgi:hypothetical protein